MAEQTKSPCTRRKHPRRFDRVGAVLTFGPMAPSRGQPAPAGGLGTRRPMRLVSLKMKFNGAPLVWRKELPRQERREDAPAYRAPGTSTPSGTQPTSTARAPKVLGEQASTDIGKKAQHRPT